MELRHLRYFVVAAEELNISHAAKRLHVSQPPLSRQLRDLETEIGAALFERRQRGLRLTEAGRSFLKEAQAILWHSQRAVELARAADRGEAGHLEIAYVGAMGGVFLPRVMRRFRQRFPLVEFGVRQLNPQQQVESLLNDQIDLGFIGMRFPGFQKELGFQCIRQAEIMVALPPDHPLLAGPIRLPALARERFIFLESASSPPFHDRLLDLCRTAGFVPNIAYAVDSAPTLLDFVSAGFGVALVPELFQRYVATEAVFRPLQDSPATLDLFVAWRRANPSPTLLTFLKLLREQNPLAGKGAGKHKS
jgi:DNA-binding transcriptional LysR family regulator